MNQRADKLVVTGGAGFIGSHLVDRLLADTRANVVVFDNLSRGRLANLTQHRFEPRFEFIEGDVRDSATLEDAIRGASVVYHLAAQSTVMGAIADVDYGFTTNVVGTFNVLRTASQHAVERVVFTSSREVYGEPIELPVDEGQPLLAINLYGASKVVGEAYCRAFRRAYGLQSVILRLANTYGPRDFGRVIPLWLEQAAAGEDLVIYGGKQVVDFVWIDQVVEALIRAALFSGTLPPVNIASGNGTRLPDLARRIMFLAGASGKVRTLPARAVEVVRFIASVDRMRQLLQIEPPLDPLANLASLAELPAAARV